LEVGHFIDRIVLYNRQDCCQFRLNNAQVFVDDELCGTVTQQEDQLVYPVSCGREGTTVKIQIGSEYLTLCEVQVIGYKLLSENIAAGKATEQSSLHDFGTSDKAVDGNTSGNWNDQTCTHSAGGELNNWWKVNLDGNFAIDHVTVYNRQDCCSDRLNGAMVYAGDVYCGTINVESGRTRYIVLCDGVVADFVEIRQPYDVLTLCEVEVYGEASDEEPMRNIALNMEATQSSLYENFPATLATDGRVSGEWDQGTCTHTQNNNEAEWWSLEFEGSNFVDRVVVYNRRDCCQDRLNNAQVFVDDELCGNITVSSASLVYPVECGIIGSTVKIQVANYLTLCEVEVIGEEVDMRSAAVTIKKAGALSKPQQSGKKLTLSCDLDLENMELSDDSNVSWYKVSFDGTAKKLKTKKKKSSYTLKIKKPKARDSGLYRCKFEQDGVSAEADVTLRIE